MLMETVPILLSLVALVVSILSYRHAKSIKAIDLRIEANKVLEEVRQKLGTLIRSHSGALPARKALNAARGVLGSSATQTYENTWKGNAQRIQGIEREFAKISAPVSRSDGARIEQVTTDLHRLRAEIESLQSQYDTDAAYNEREQAALRADRRERT